MRPEFHPRPVTHRRQKQEDRVARAPGPGGPHPWNRIGTALAEWETAMSTVDKVMHDKEDAALKRLTEGTDQQLRRDFELATAKAQARGRAENIGAHEGQVGITPRLAGLMTSLESAATPTPANKVV